jgi:hypothetical protein
VELWRTQGMFPALSTRRGRRACWSFEMGLGRVTSFTYLLKPASNYNKLVNSIFGAPLVLRQISGNPRLTRLTTARTWGKPPPSPIYYSLRFHGTYIRMAFCLETPKEEFRKLSLFGLLGLCEVITLCPYPQLGWGLKQTCSPPPELSNRVLHLTRTHRGWVDSQLLVVRVKRPVWLLALLFAITCAVNVQMAHARPFLTSTLW